MRRRHQSIWLVLITFGISCSVHAQVPEQPNFDEHIQPILQTLCFECHAEGADEGGVEFDAAESVEALLANRPLWGKVWDNVLAEVMPPADMPQLTETERRTLSRWIGQTVFQLDSGAPDPGRVTIRRLNRVEYRYAVLDLLGIDFEVAEHFPVDDTGYGFDTIGDVLTVPPTLMEKYFVAAEQISEELLEQETAAKSDRSNANEHVFGSDKLPSDPAELFERAREIIERIATRAYRQPVDEATVNRLLSLNKGAFDADEASFAELVCRAIEAILVSPRFLYRAEFQPGPDDPHRVHPLDEFALASRLSFFLWSSLPDEQLLTLASKSQLREQLRAQVDRMLQDEKSSRFVENFVGQWLRTRDVAGLHRSTEYHEIVRRLRRDMRDETYAFFTHIMREDRDVIELVAADYSFLTEDLASFYGVPDIKGSDPQLVKFPADSPRGGVLTHASVLMVTSNPDRTSPVKRGQFVLDNILGMPAPPPPDNVPPLKESRVEGKQLGLLAQLARHRADPNCATCHDRMDPLGLGLENFDAIGRWRDEDGGQPIDASSQLASGEKFSGIRELREILAQKKRLFYRCLTKKLMTYALGRGIEYTDNQQVETIVDAMMAEEGHFSTMLMGIVESPQFQMRRGNNTTK
ncbi:MAG: DUF1592 domain-containing protein [Planctomycetes bacterium]|nr:DUF1592 domain-containing protein [Planctomycetota bacterium]